MKKVTFVTLLMVLVMAIAACTPAPADDTSTMSPAPTMETGTDAETGTDMEEPAAEGATPDITIEGLSTLKWEPAAVTAAAGETLNITITSDGALEHNFVWADEEGTDFLHVAPGETTDGPASRTFDTAGTYDFYCTVPGHREAGMVGAVTVN